MDWKERCKAEYDELCERCDKLGAMLTQYTYGTLDFEPNCPVWLLNEQWKAMDRYRQILEARNHIEHMWEV